MSVRPVLRLGVGVVVLGVSVAAAATPGRDFVPADWAREGSLDVDGVAAYVLMDAIGVGADLWVLYGDPAAPGTLRIDRFDPTSGARGAFLGRSTVVLRPDTAAGSVEAHGINSGQIVACAAHHVVDEPLTWDGSRWRTAHIGVHPESVQVRGRGGLCPTVGMTRGSFTEGYLNSGTYTTDGFTLRRTGGCAAFTATYDYTTCGFSGPDAYRCAVEPDPVRDLNAELGACGYLLMYEAQYDGDGQSKTVDDRVLLAAHARDPDGPWVRYLPSGGAHPTVADVRVLNTSEHAGDGAANLHSFVSVPTLWYDEGQALWRMWFVTEDAGRPSIRYSESDDDGQSWGIGGGSGGPIDCWDGAAFDTSACTEIAWSGTPPPNDTTNPDTRDPDSVDPEVVPGEFDGRAGLDLGMMFTGGDDGCADGDWGVLLWQVHHAFGDQSGGADWRWVTRVAADGVDGVVMDKDRSTCTGAGFVMDPEIVRWNAGYLAFVNAQGGIHLAASGFACSDFQDDDGDGLVDWPADPGCTNPWDDAE